MLRIFIKQISGTSGGKTLSRARHIRLSPTIMKIFERGFILGKYNVSSFIGNVFRREYLNAHAKFILLEGYAGREGHSRLIVSIWMIMKTTTLK